MRLTRIDAKRLPGGDAGFAVGDLAPGLNVLLGPNGSGKSSLCLAVQATLFEGVVPPPDTELVTHWETSAGPLRAELAHAVRWQRDGADVEAPASPAGHLAGVYRLGLRDLLSPEHPNDRELARQVRIQIAGGFDLAGVRPAEPSSRFANTEAKVLREASEALRRLRGERRLLAEQEEQLAELRVELEAARDVEGRKQLLVAAQELAQQRIRLDELDREIAALGTPKDVLERMTGQELQDFDRIEEELGRTLALLEAKRGELREAERRKAETELPEGPLGQESLGVLRRRAIELQQADDGLVQLRSELAKREGAHREALVALGGDRVAGEPAAIGSAAFDELALWTEQALRRLERRTAIEARLESATTVDRDTLGAELARLRRAADELRDWLASPGDAGHRGALALGLLVLALATAAAAAGWLEPDWLRLGALDPGWLLVAAALLGGALGVSATVLLAGRRGGRRREIAAHLRESGVVLPERLDAESVRARLAELDACVAETSRLHAEAAEATRLRGELAHLDRKQQELAAESESLRARLGIAPALSAAAVSELLARMRVWREAAEAQAGARRQLEAATVAREEQVARIGEAAGIDFGPQAEGVVVQEAVAELAERCRSWRSEDARAHQLREILDAAGASRQRLEAERAALLARCGLEVQPDAGRVRSIIDERRATREAYQLHAARHRACLDRIETLRAALDPHPKLHTLSLSEVEDQLREATRLAGRIEELVGHIAGVEERVRAASEGRAVEEAAARVDGAHDALLARRDELVEALVARLLLEEVESEYEERTRPEVLQRASDLFSRFTHHRYSLSVAHTGDASLFRAVDAETGRGLALSELSDGTRMQLLLAARLAFATGLEGDEPLPLFLDEALTASDPVRFRAVAQALVELAAEGRQIFYLTCKSSDVSLFEAECRALGAPAPHRIDFAQARKLAASVQDTLDFGVPASKRVPAPRGQEAAAYARRLGVARPDPFAPADALSLFFVLSDELALFHRLLDEVGVERIGPWRVFARTGAPPSVFAPDEIRRIEEGARVAEHLLAIWRIGRGRPLCRDDLVTSGAVSEAFIDSVTDLAADLDWRADRLIAALELRQDPRAQRFRNEKREDLRAHLVEVGCLDPRAPLDTEAIGLRTLGDYLGQSGDAALPAPVVRDIVRALLAAIGERPVPHGSREEEA